MFHFRESGEQKKNRFRQLKLIEKAILTGILVLMNTISVQQATKRLIPLSKRLTAKKFSPKNPRVKKQFCIFICPD
jgi:hypothetical protein